MEKVFETKVYVDDDQVLLVKAYEPFFEKNFEQQITIWLNTFENLREMHKDEHTED